jgi:hypothetical protein
VALLGYDLAETMVGRGGTLHLTLYWQSRREMSVSYTVFAHVVDEQGNIRGQWDSVPDGGRNPSNEWATDEIVVDRYEIPIGDEIAPGPHTLRVGMYDLLTGERLPVRDRAGDLTSGAYVSLGRIAVVE